MKIKGTKKRDCDLIVNNIGVELRTAKREKPWSHRISVFRQHPNADMYMLLTWQTNKLSKKFVSWLQENKLEYEDRELEGGWTVWICKTKS